MTKHWLLLCSIFLIGDLCAMPLGVISACHKSGIATLTFDDGINSNTPRILDILANNQIKATFFTIGETLTPKTLPLLHRTFKEGHTIGNHSWSHPSLVRISQVRLKNEVLNTQNGFLSLATTPIKKYLRPPYGAINADVYRTLSQMGFTVILWNLDIKDWDGHRSKDRLWSSFMNQLKQTNPIKQSLIILLHNETKTADLLPDIITSVKARNFKIVSLEECVPTT